MSPRLSGAVLFSSLLRWCRCPGSLDVILCARWPDFVDVCSEDLLRPFSDEEAASWGSWNSQGVTSDDGCGVRGRELVGEAGLEL